MKMFRERRPIPIGALTVTWVLVFVLGVLNINTIVGAFGRQYTAVVAETAGLAVGSPVIVSGLEVGRVKDVELTEEGVAVDFTITNDDIELGDETTAAIKIATVLGDRALVLAPAGDGTLEPDSTIPLGRSSAPYDISAALTDLTEETGGIDIPRVSKALEVVASTMDTTAPELQTAVRGVARLAETIGSRDRQLQELLGHASRFTDVLADHADQLVTLVDDGNKLLEALVERRDVIETLLANVTAMSQQLEGLVRDNEARLGPTLRHLNTVLELLTKNKAQLTELIHNSSIYATALGEAVANGRFFSAIIQNLPPTNLTPSLLDLHTGRSGGTQ